ncbi:MAG: AAA family ATPase [Actinomycetota bacterium]|nr:AAA family ATPase [Actinomycetota bacterium]MDQ2956783.1 AAA family ATPase [Actinomycetota bacterium]
MPFTLTWTARTPAIARLEWILDGLNAGPGWGTDLDQVFDPDFLAAIAPLDYRQVVEERALKYAPVELVGLEVAEHTAKATLRNQAGEVGVLSCTVEPVSPYRIVQTYLQPVVPPGLTARLPMDCSGWPATAAPGNRLIVFGGVPGSGKSTLADAVGRQLGIPVFAIDWLLGALTPFGGRHLDRLLELGYEQLTTLAVRQLALGQSAILDAPVEDVALRQRWSSLARATGASFTAVLSSCPDTALHRARLASRDRGIPGWHQGADWIDVSRRLEAFPPWPDALLIDSTQPLETNLAAVLAQLDNPG